MDASIVTSYLIENLQVIRGKKAFQKLIYLSKAVGIPLDESYKMYYYGPYSEQVADELELFLTADILQKDIGTYNLVPGKRQKDILNINKESIDRYKEKLDLVVKDFGNCDPMELEIISTTHFIYNSMKYLYCISEKSEIIEEVKKVKYPKFSETQIDNSYNRLSKMGLLA